MIFLLCSFVVYGCEHLNRNFEKNVKQYHVLWMTDFAGYFIYHSIYLSGFMMRVKCNVYIIE